MNKTQKYFVIIGVMSFLYWFLKPFSMEHSVSFIYKMEHFIIGGFNPFNYESLWFQFPLQHISFDLMIGSGLGYHLFKDTKKTKATPTF